MADHLIVEMSDTYDNEYTSDNDHEYNFYDNVDANDYCRRGTPALYLPILLEKRHPSLKDRPLASGSVVHLTLPLLILDSILYQELGSVHAILGPCYGHNPGKGRKISYCCKRWTRKLWLGNK